MDLPIHFDTDTDFGFFPVSANTGNGFADLIFLSCIISFGLFPIGVLFLFQSLSSRSFIAPKLSRSCGRICCSKDLANIDLALLFGLRKFIKLSCFDNEPVLFLVGVPNLVWVSLGLLFPFFVSVVLGSSLPSSLFPRSSL